MHYFIDYIETVSFNANYPAIIYFFFTSVKEVDDYVIDYLAPTYCLLPAMIFDAFNEKISIVSFLQLFSTCPIRIIEAFNLFDVSFFIEHFDDFKFLEKQWIIGFLLNFVIKTIRSDFSPDLILNKQIFLDATTFYFNLIETMSLDDINSILGLIRKIITISNDHMMTLINDEKQFSSLLTIGETWNDTSIADFLDYLQDLQKVIQINE